MKLYEQKNSIVQRDHLHFSSYFTFRFRLKRFWSIIYDFYRYIFM